MTERTKLVVRHLPPSLPEEVFWKTLCPWLDPTPLEDGLLAPPRCTATFKSYLPGKPQRNKTKVEIPSRAYIQFATVDQVVEFHQGYASQAFRDSHGNLTFPKVEFAPYQKVAGPPKKVDNRIGTIDSDQEYLAFLERLDAPAVPEATSPTKADEAPEKVEQPQITPLIEHLRNVRKAAHEATAAAKQQRQSAATSGKSAAGRSGPPQVLKRPATNTANNSPAGLPARKSGDPALHDLPPHMSKSAPPSSSSKAVKQTGKSSSTLPSSTGQTTAPDNSNAPKSRSNKSSKSKRAGRAAEDASCHPSATEPKGKRPAAATPQQPKTILQAPKPSDTNTDKPAPLPNKSSVQTTSKDGNASRFKYGSPLPEHQSGQDKAAASARDGAAGSKKSGRAGRGGKSSSGPATPNSQQTQPSSSAPAAAVQKSSKNPDAGKVSEPNSSETAAARRRLGNALAGITSKPDRPLKKKQNSKPPPHSGSPTIPPPVD
ncbi:hypothetical protein VP01_2382g1 [Puccinia sorghi]|uniref:UPF3 domain-containing protein n=1 Tax=Puccinia sorghi TaxID=27349 RepID=A0A0L6V726_9BASI|nr:hypothetical protein VP01_2382g1 [Puccinia sorghi]